MPADTPKPTALPRLTPRQQEVLALSAASEYPDGEIGCRSYSLRDKTCGSLVWRGLLRRGPCYGGWSSYLITEEGRRVAEALKAREVRRG
jgi:hypothetical protein